MRILLIEPPKAAITIGGEDIFVYEPLALEYLAAGVAPDHEVRILDMRLGESLDDALAGFLPDVVGITSYTVHVNTVRQLFARVKAWRPGILTVVGGHHATVQPRDFLSPAIDLIVRGEGVLPFRQIVEQFERNEGFDGIPGLAFAKGGDLVTVDYTARIDLDALPFPARWATAETRHRYYSEWMKPLASIRTSKGCPHRCSFCALWKVAGGHYLKRSPECIVEELAQIEEPYVFFADDESLVDAARMEVLARRIREAGIEKQYFLYGRSDTIASNPGLLELWRSVGLERVFVGLEFFRDGDLAYIRKGSTTGHNAAAVKILRELDIEVYASFIVRPEFGKRDFGAFREYCRDLGLVFATFAVLTPLPGTDFYEEVRHQLITHDYDFFDFIHTLLPTKLSLKDFYEELYRLNMGAIPLGRRTSLLRKYSLSEMPLIMAKAVRAYNRIRRAYLDYEAVVG